MVYILQYKGKYYTFGPDGQCNRKLVATPEVIANALFQCTK